MQTPATTDVIKTRKPPRLHMCRLHLHFFRFIGRLASASFQPNSGKKVDLFFSTVGSAAEQANGAKGARRLSV
jgi:hypothetical protein